MLPLARCRRIVRRRGAYLNVRTGPDTTQCVRLSNADAWLYLASRAQGGRVAAVETPQGLVFP